MKATKEQIYGVAGSLIINALILLLLFFIVIKTVIPEEEGGILVAFGNVNEAAGTFEPRTVDAPPAEQTPQVQQPSKPEVSTPSKPKVSVPPKPVITQSREQTIKVPETKPKKDAQKEQDLRTAQERQRQQELQRQQEQQRRQQQEEQQRRQTINNQVAGALGGSSSSGTGSRGTSTSGTGIQGSAQGNSTQGASSGIGGTGEFSLAGRSLGSGGLPKPAYSVQEEGRIVVNITVDPKGNIIFAEIGRGTNIDNATMRNSALEAARKAKFNVINGTNNQSGTITYKYSFK